MSYHKALGFTGDEHTAIDQPGLPGAGSIAGAGTGQSQSSGGGIADFFSKVLGGATTGMLASANAGASQQVLAAQAAKSAKQTQMIMIGGVLLVGALFLLKD